MTSRFTGLSAVIVLGALAVAEPCPAQPVFSGGFTYQGRIDSNGTPVDSTVDLGFTLWDSPGQGNPPMGGQFIGVVALPGVRVTDGLFTVVLNANGEFGPNAFSGGDRWLQIAVNTQILGPRQRITATPFSQRAATADVATVAQSVEGVTGYSLRGADGGPMDALYVNAQGNVGIGTTTPAARLHNTGEYYGLGLLSLYSSAGEGQYGNAIIRARDHAELSSVGLKFDVQIDGQSNPCMLMKPNGRVLIGPDTPSPMPAALHVNGSNDPAAALIVETGQSNFVVRRHAAQSQTTVLENSQAGGFYFNSAVGVHCQPGTALDVNGTFRVTQNSAFGTTSAPYLNVSLFSAAGGNAYALKTSGDVLVEGHVTAHDYSTTSDARFKTNIEPYSGGLDTVTKLRSVRYRMDTQRWPERKFSERPQIGLIAQEVELVVPEVVSCDPEGYLSVDYSRLSALLIDAMHEMNEHVAELHARVRALETERDARVVALETRLAALEATSEK